MINFFTDETKFIRIMRFTFIFIEMLVNIKLFPANIVSPIAILAALAGLLNLVLIIKDNPKRLKNIFVYCWIYIIAMMIISTYINKGFDYTLSLKYDYAKNFIWFSLYFLRNDTSKNQIKNEIILFAKIFVIFTVFFSLVTFIMSSLDIQINIFGKEIAPELILGTDNKGIYTQHNMHGIISSISAMSAIYLVTNATKIPQKVIYSLCFIIEIVCLYLSGSRNSQVGLVLALVIFGFYLFKNKYPKAISFKLILYVIPVLLIACTAIGYITMKEFLVDDYFSNERYNSYIQRYPDKNASNYLSKEEWIISTISSGRYIIQKETFIMAMDYPIVGNGHNTLIENANETFPDYNAIGDSLFNCHFFILQVFYETGIGGLIFAILITIKALMVAFKTFVKEKSSFYGYLVGMVVISLVYGFLDVGIFIDGWFTNSIIWLYIGALFYSYLFKKKKGEN